MVHPLIRRRRARAAAAAAAAALAEPHAKPANPREGKPAPKAKKLVKTTPKKDK